MIMTVEKVKQLMDVGEWDDETIILFLGQFEDIIRGQTANLFINKMLPIDVTVNADGSLTGSVNRIVKGETIYISKAPYSKGAIRTVIQKNSTSIFLDEPLPESEGEVIRIFRVEYPKAILSGVINLMKYVKTTEDKMGIQSESLSRYSVTYSSPSSGATIGGYPAYLFDFIKPYYQARFN